MKGVDTNGQHTKKDGIIKEKQVILGNAPNASLQNGEYLRKMIFETTTMTDNYGNNSWGIIVRDFKSEKEAKLFIKDLKRILEEYIKK